MNPWDMLFNPGATGFPGTTPLLPTAGISPFGGQMPDSAGANPFEPTASLGGGDVGASSVSMGGGGSGGGGMPSSDKILGALKGVQPPPKPDVVKPTTPALPRLRDIKEGQLFELLNSVTNPRATPPRPMTLGGSLGTGRY